MTRKLLMWAVVLAGLCAGQGCPGTQPTEPLFDRLAVNNHLRDACKGWPDDYIKATINVIEEDRLAGFSITEELTAGIEPCETAQCLTCAAALVNQVYGQE